MKIKYGVIGVTLAVLVGLMVACAPGKPREMPHRDPKMPEFEGTVLTEADIAEIVEWGERFDAAGGAQESTILLVHKFQEVSAALVKALDTSSDGDEIALLLDMFYAYSLSLEKDAANLNLPPPDSEFFKTVVSRENDISGRNLGRIKQALRDWIVTHHGADLTTKPENVFVGITPEMIKKVADLLDTTPEDIRKRLEDIPPNERLTWERPGSVIVQPDGKPYPQPSTPWWKRAWSGVKKTATKVATKVAIPAKLGHLVAKYGYAIADCYYQHFPDFAAIENCLVQKHGLNANVVQRIINALLDP